MKTSRNDRAVRRTSRKKWLTGIIAAVVTVCIAVGGTIAFLTAYTEPITNTFQMSTVDIDITDKVEDEVKKDVGVRNNSTDGVPIYARIRFVTYWEDKDGNIVASDEQPILPFENGAKDEAGENMVLDTENWFEYNGYYYYRHQLNKGDTAKLFESFKMDVDEKKGLHQVLEVLAEGIQSMPEEAVEDAWGMEVVDGQLVAPDSSNN
ncbi:MAG: hypothetical protein ACLU8W_12040 [Clostridia bacterium]